MFLREKNHPRGAVGVEIRKFDGEHYRIYFGFSFCGPEDKFTKAEAIEWATGEGRVLSVPLTRAEVSVLELEDLYEVWRCSLKGPHKAYPLLKANSHKFKSTLKSAIDDVNGIRQCDKVLA